MTERFGNYELHRRIGGGGMADVYAARRMTASGEMVCALKVIRPQAEHNDSYRRLFLSEGELAMKLRHGTVVPVFDVGEHAGSLYMAMELIDGVSLDRFLELVRARAPHRPNIAEAVYVVRRVLRALHYVHTFSINEVNRRIVHRDVSPQNVMVTSSGEVKLADFGIARAVDGRTTTRVYGKLAYMPKEQYLGNPVQQSDLFATGAILYELLTGRRLRERCRNQHEFHDVIMDGWLPELPRGLPSEVYETLAGLLEVDPARRTPSAKHALRLLGSSPRTGDVQLDIEELYLTHVDSRHSWYTELTAQAKEPTAVGSERGKSRARTKTQRRPRPSRADEGEASGTETEGVETAAPIPGRPWERARGHDAAIEEMTTLRWQRPRNDGPTGEVRP